MSEQIVHVEQEAYNDAHTTYGIDVWKMWCGAECLAMPDGELVPDGFDFYGERQAEKATCPGCRRVLLDLPATEQPASVPA